MTPAQAKRRAVFLDRDGTIIEDVHFLADPGELKMCPGADEAIRRLRAAGFLIVVITNQSGVARGYLSEEKLAGIHEQILAGFAAAGAPIDAIYYCPHLPEGEIARYATECDCRKPAPGMILRAAREHGIDLAASWMVGDSERDVEAGLRAGCRAVRIAVADTPSQTEAVVADLAAAAEIILAAPPRQGSK